jgi:hypothetical protein
MLFKPGDRVRYDGRDMDKLGLKFDMEGEVIRCYQDSVDVHFSDLQRVVHLMDFHMRTSLKRIPAITAAKKGEAKSSAMRMRTFGLTALILLIVATIVFIIQFY